MKKYIFITFLIFLSNFLSIAQTFSSGDINIPIPDNQPYPGGIRDTINVSGIGNLDDNNFALKSVCIYIQHTFNEDLQIYLKNPLGTEIELSTNNGGSGNGYGTSIGSMCFDMYEDYVIAFNSASSLINGNWLPEGNLLDFNNQNADGYWQICIADDAGSDIGNLLGWSITFGTPPPPSCFDRIMNQDELGIDCGGSCSDCIAGMSCGNPELINSIPYNYSGTTCGYKKNYYSSDICEGDLLHGEDFVFEYIPSSDERLIITLSSNDNTNSVLFITKGCLDTGNCVSVINSESNPFEKQVTLEAEEIYFFTVSTWSTTPPDCIDNFTLDIIYFDDSGTSCNNPRIISLPYSLHGTTCGYINDYPKEGLCNVNKLYGEDFILEYTPQVDENIFVNIPYGVYVFLSKGCIDNNSCYWKFTNTSSAESWIHIYKDTTYYFTITNYSNCVEDFYLEIGNLTCFDGIQNYNETGIDCGGICPDCSIGSNCYSAKPICSSSTRNLQLQTNNGNAIEDYQYDFGCLCSAPNPAWYIIQIAESGDLNLHISSAVGDLNFVAWGPFSTPTCDALELTGDSSDCSTIPYNIPHGKIVDCSYSTQNEEDIYIPNGQTGEYYLLLITNPSNVKGVVSLEQTFGTGSTNCNIVKNCDIQEITRQLSGCVTEDDKYSINGKIYLSNSTIGKTLKICDLNSGICQIINSPLISPVEYNLSNLSANGYIHRLTATLSDWALCSKEEYYVAPKKISINNYSVNPSCSYVNSGSIKLSIQGGTPPYSYLWSSGDTSNVINNLSIGDYSVSVFDIYNCTTSSSFNIYSEDIYAKTYSTIASTPFVNDAFAKIISITGGNPPYSILWDNFCDSTINTNLFTGYHSYEIIDSLGCIYRDTIFINFDEENTKNLLGDYLYDFFLYPNPVNDYLYLKFISNYKHFQDIYCFIYNSEGKLVYEDFFEKDKILFIKEINISKFEKGPYLLIIYNNYDDIFISRKFIIE